LRSASGNDWIVAARRLKFALTGELPIAKAFAQALQIRPFGCGPAIPVDLVRVAAAGAESKADGDNQAEDQGVQCGCIEDSIRDAFSMLHGQSARIAPSGVGQPEPRRA